MQLPSGWRRTCVPLVGWPGQHQQTVLVLGPLRLHFIFVSAPRFWISVDCPSDVRRVGRVSSEHLQPVRGLQLDEFFQGSELVEALDEDLKVAVQCAALLAFYGAVDCVHPSKHSTSSSCVAPKAVHAGLVCGIAVWAPGAAADTKQMLQGEQDQSAEAICACQWISGKHCSALFVVGQLLKQQKVLWICQFENEFHEFHLHAKVEHGCAGATKYRSAACFCTRGNTNYCYMEMLHPIAQVV